MLDGIDTALIEQVKRDNAEFRSLLEAHQQYEVELEAYNGLRFMTAEQEIDRKRLQKLKLQGKDRMLAILRQYQPLAWPGYLDTVSRFACGDAVRAGAMYSLCPWPWGHAVLWNGGDRSSDPQGSCRRERNEVMQGADIFVESLLREGVDTIFGHPGGAILPLNDALYSGRIRHILTRHEQGAVHMAEGYARATGRPGVVLVTSGPGGTNIVTGLTDAFMDSTPIVVFTGQVPTGVIGNDAFQEADIVGITRSCTKHNYLVRDVQDLARTIKEAFHIASTGRPGPVLVDIPKDVSQSVYDFDVSHPGQSAWL